jgi:SET domain-containing protein
MVSMTLPSKTYRRKTVVRTSTVHGKGVFATTDIARGELLFEYKGERITWPEALDRHPHDPEHPNHTFYFDIDDNMVIDGKVGGNSSRWINHSCKPNCTAKQVNTDGKTRVFIYAKRQLKRGEELFYDYGLIIDDKITKKLQKEYLCLCGAKNCRGTMLKSTRE